MNREVGRRQDRGGGDRCQRDDEDRGNQGNAVLSALHGVGSAGGGAVIARATSGSSPRRNTKRSSPRSLLVSRTSTAIGGATAARSEERSGGKEWCRTWSSRWVPYQ